MSLTKAPKATSVAANKPAAPQTFEATASEAPHRLPAYHEPKPFITARSLKSFTVASVVACGCAFAFYRLLAKGVDAVQEEQQAAASKLLTPVPVVKSRATSTAAPALPSFAAPKSFSDLSRLAASENAMTVGTPTEAVDSRPRPQLHEEAWARFRTSWNEAVDALEGSVVALEKQRKEYRESAAVAAIRAELAAQYPDSTVQLSTA